MVKYCPKCGYPNPDDAMYCVRCGTPLATVQPQPQSAPQQPINYPQQPPQPPQYTQQPNPVYPYQQYPYPKRRKFPIKAVIGAVIAVVVVLVVVFVVLPMFFGPSYPISASDLQSIYGGSWKVMTNSSGTVSISTSLVTISYLNGTKETLPVTPSNDTCSVFILGKEPDSYLSKEVFVTFYYVIPPSMESGTAYECVVYPVAGSPFYTELTTMGEGAFVNTFGVSFVTVNGNIMYGYSNNLDGYGPGVVILNKANGELVMIVGLPYINSTIASELASHV
ncbi:MAG: zinc ribbon domain-containing protein [Sulfolobus sp.]